MAVEITRTPSSNGNQKIWTWSGWIKKATVGMGSGDYQMLFTANIGSGSRYTDVFFREDYFEVFGGVYSTSTTTVDINVSTNRKFRDPSAFYHLVVAVDTTQATASNRVKIYVNGVQETSLKNYQGSSVVYPAQNNNTFMNVTTAQNRIGASGGSYPFKGLMTHVHFIDGTAYTPSTFGETDSTSGIWKPKASPTGITYGTNGFFLKFENSGNLDLDSSGNNHTFATSGTLTQNVDTPSNNFATLNSIHTGGGSLAFGNGNLYNGSQSPNYWQSVPATLGLSTGKWYWELKDESDWGSTSDSTRRYGICDYDSIVSTLGSGADVRFSGDTSAYAYMNASGVRHNGSTISGTTSTHPTFQEGDFLMVAMDLDHQKLYFGKNGTWNDSGNPASGASGTGSVADISATATWSPYIETKYGSDNVSLNFGQGYFRTAVAGTNSDSAGIGKFKYTVPSGYYSICSKNIKDYG